MILTDVVMENSLGPRIEPWRTPFVRGRASEVDVDALNYVEVWLEPTQNQLDHAWITVGSHLDHDPMRAFVLPCFDQQCLKSASGIFRRGTGPRPLSLDFFSNINCGTSMAN